MNQADVTRLVSKLKFNIQATPRKLKTKDGPLGRLNKLRKTVNALIKHERIELNYPRADEARAYAERLISEAIRYGDKHRTTMDMADFWLEDKQLIHKLFKVLAPRYENYNVSYTKMYKAPQPYPGEPFQKAILELRGNSYPPLVPDTYNNRNLIHNVLLDEAKKDYRTKKYQEIAQKIAAEEQKSVVAKANVKSVESESNTDSLSNVIETSAENKSTTST